MFGGGEIKMVEVPATVDDCEYSRRALGIMNRDLRQLKNSLQHWLPDTPNRQHLLEDLERMRISIAIAVHDHRQECQCHRKLVPSNEAGKYKLVEG